MRWDRASFVARVFDLKQASAQKQLTDAAFVALSSTQARLLVEQPLPVASYHYFLLRALEYQKGRASFKFESSMGNMEVTFATLGDTPPQAKRAAIVPV